MSLYQHGILNEESDYRIHVCAGERRAYGFSTRFANEVIAQGRYQLKPVYTGGEETAEGYPIPPEALQAFNVPIPVEWWDEVSIKKDDGTLAMGRKAEQLITRALELGRVPLPLEYRVAEREEQYKGWDLLVSLIGLKIEVKCDYDGGVTGTGNLFLQTAERQTPDEFK